MPSPRRRYTRSRNASSFDGRGGRGFIAGSPGVRRYFRTVFLEMAKVRAISRMERCCPCKLPELLHGSSSQHRSEEHTSELQSLAYLVCRLLLEKKKTILIELQRTNRV